MTLNTRLLKLLPFIIVYTLNDSPYAPFLVHTVVAASPPPIPANLTAPLEERTDHNYDWDDPDFNALCIARSPFEGAYRGVDERGKKSCQGLYHFSMWCSTSQRVNSGGRIYNVSRELFDFKCKDGYFCQPCNSENLVPVIADSLPRWIVQSIRCARVRKYGYDYLPPGYRGLWIGESSQAPRGSSSSSMFMGLSGDTNSLYYDMIVHYYGPNNPYGHGRSITLGKKHFENTTADGTFHQFNFAYDMPKGGVSGDWFQPVIRFHGEVKKSLMINTALGFASG